MKKSFQKLIAKYYNLIDSDYFKIVVKPIVYTVGIAYLMLLSEQVNEYTQTVGDWGYPALAGLNIALGQTIGYIERRIAKKGEVELIKDGDLEIIDRKLKKRDLLDMELSIKGY